MKVMSNGRVRRSAEEWSDIISRYAGSGLSLRGFCRREGVSENSMKRWQQRLGDGSGSFVELTPPDPTSRPGWSCEVRLPDGTQLQFRG